MKKTDEQIATELGKLRELKLKVPQFNAFSDNNHDAIDAQCQVLEQRMSLDDIYDRWGDEESESFAQHTLDEAIEAHDWMAGKEMSPAESWEPAARSR